MNQLYVHVAAGDDTQAVLNALDSELGQHEYSPQIVFAFYGCELDDTLPA